MKLALFELQLKCIVIYFKYYLLRYYYNYNILIVVKELTKKINIAEYKQDNLAN